MLTFCCRQRSRLLLVIKFLSTPSVFTARSWFSMSGIVKSRLAAEEDRNGKTPVSLKLSFLEGLLAVLLFSISTELYLSVVLIVKLYNCSSLIQLKFSALKMITL